MKNLLKYFNIAKLISGHVSESTDPINPDLQDWINTSDQNNETFDNLTSGSNLNQLLDEYEQIDAEKAWNQLYAKLPQANKRSLWNKGLRIAAMISVPLMIGGAGYYFVIHLKEGKSNQAPVAVKMDYKPGSSKAMLILADGSKVDLNNPGAKQLLDKDGTVIKNQNAGLVYASTNSKTIAPVFNTLIIPAGGEYKITLSDGTKVWLNASSQLKYPTQFSNNKREVFLEGEAYFEVTHNPKKPFEVHTSGITTKVFGTEFNVMAYNDEPNIQTTLVNGSVEVQNNATSGKSIMLKPGLQANLNKGSNSLDAKAVNTYIYTSWKDGVFFFNNENMESIMRKLSRWYNVKITFDSESTKEILFFGKVKRYENINSILNMIKKTEEVTYSTENNQIIIRKR
jgi:transmembrane sensor